MRRHDYNWRLFRGRLFADNLHPVEGSGDKHESHKDSRKVLEGPVGREEGKVDY